MPQEDNRSMSKPLRVLLVEDSDDDAALIIRELQLSGFNVISERVYTKESMRLALETRTWDLILCDYTMPNFDSKSALALMHAQGLDLPFLIISGTISDEIAADAMAAGAHDYFVKDKLGIRLAAAIKRELREADIRAERKAMQEQIMISERMASMGTLAADVAHDINNPLASVMANLELAQRDIAALGERKNIASELNEVKEELRDAYEAADRIRNIVRGMKIFSRSESDKKTAVDVHEIMDSILRMAWNEIRHRAQLVKNYGSVSFVEANESKLGQVFLNIVVNAAQAIEAGHAQDNAIRISTHMGDKGDVIIETEDTGCGMSEEVLKKIFTPFFTTKTGGLGTGLGLSICHRIVTELGGSIEVKSKVGKGSVFSISLPSAGTGLLKVNPPVEAHVITAKRRGKILVIDDEPMITKALEHILSNDHDVVAYNNASDALQCIASGNRFDVILCDLMMPEMMGEDFHDKLKSIASDQVERIIFLTGGSFTAKARAFLDATSNEYLEKPFEAKHIRTMVNERIQ